MCAMNSRMIFNETDINIIYFYNDDEFIWCSYVTSTKNDNRKNFCNCQSTWIHIEYEYEWTFFLSLHYHSSKNTSNAIEEKKGERGERWERNDWTPFIIYRPHEYKYNGIEIAKANQFPPFSSLFNDNVVLKLKNKRKKRERNKCFHAPENLL